MEEWNGSWPTTHFFALESSIRSEIIIYQLGAMGGHRMITKVPNDHSGTTAPVKWKDGLAHLWKELPTSIGIADQGSFDETLDSGLLRFWTSTATLYVRRQGLYPRSCPPNYYFLESKRL